MHELHWQRQKAPGSLITCSRGQGAEKAQRGRAREAPGPPYPFSFPLWARLFLYILISVRFLRLVGLLSYGPCMAYSRYFMLFRTALVPLLPHNPWSLPQASLIGPKLGLAGGISRGAQIGPYKHPYFNLIGL